MSDKIARRLSEILQSLPAEQAQQLLEFAEFLLARHGRAPDVSEPLAIPRPQSETVIRAIQRLRATYPMLDPAKLLNETAVLMTQHVTQGRDAVEVIDELEILFRCHYEKSTGGRG